MCSAVTCKQCAKQTWSGCGQHIEEALAGIPESQRCQCNHNDPKEPNFLSRLFGDKK